MKIHWIRFRVNYFLPVRALLTLGRTVPFWSGNPFWLSDVMQPVTLVCVKQWAYSSSQRPLAHGGDKRHFFLIWKEITGPETALAAKQKLRPELLSTKDASQSLFVFLFFFLRAVSMCLMWLWLFHFWVALSSFKLATCSPQLGSCFHWTPQKQ